VGIALHSYLHLNKLIDSIRAFLLPQLFFQETHLT
jgi:hypothetical protein